MKHLTKVGYIFIINEFHYHFKHRNSMKVEKTTSFVFRTCFGFFGWRNHTKTS